MGISMHPGKFSEIPNMMFCYRVYKNKEKSSYKEMWAIKVDENHAAIDLIGTVENWRIVKTTCCRNWNFKTGVFKERKVIKFDPSTEVFA